jgi:hypothetical protein
LRQAIAVATRITRGGSGGGGLEFPHHNVRGEVLDRLGVDEAVVGAKKKEPDGGGEYKEELHRFDRVLDDSIKIDF